MKIQLNVRDISPDTSWPCASKYFILFAAFSLTNKMYFIIILISEIKRIPVMTLDQLANYKERPLRSRDYRLEMKCS